MKVIILTRYVMNACYYSHDKINRFTSNFCYQLLQMTTTVVFFGKKLMITEGFKQKIYNVNSEVKNNPHLVFISTN